MSSPPVPYDRQANFVSWETTNPTAPKRGTDLDAELDAIKLTLDQVMARLAEIQRADGLLANESVHPDSLHPDTAASLVVDLDPIVADAEAARDDAINAASAAQGHATSAGNSAVAAGLQASIAASHAGDAQSAAGVAAGAQVGAEDARDAADLWANAPKGTEVEPGKYSARHWAEQAQSAVTGALVFMGSWNPSSGTYPALPQTGHFYKVNGNGTIGGVEWRTGDQLIRGIGEWIKVDNTESVTSVAGKIGAVSLVAGDIGGLGALATRNTVDWTTHVIGAPSTFPPSTHSHDWSSITGKPTTFTPAAHTHPIANVTGLQTALDAKFDATDAYNAGLHPRNTGSAPTPSDASAVRGLGQPRFFRITSSANNRPFDWGVAIQAPYDASAAGAILAMSTTTDVIAWSRTGTTWRTIWHSGNFTPADYALNDTGGNARIVNSNLRHDFNISGVTEVRIQTGIVRRRNADSAVMTPQPRIFVQATDPGTAAAENDLWFW